MWMCLNFINVKFYLGFTEKALVDEQAFVSERISALNVPLVSLNPLMQNEEDEVEIDTFADVNIFVDISFKICSIITYTNNIIISRKLMLAKLKKLKLSVRKSKS